jgi:hypothetical protein
MSIHSVKQRWMTGSYPIKILPGWKRLVGPQRMVPAPAQQPLTWERLMGGDSYPLKHLRQGSASIEIHTELGLSRIRQVDVSIIKPGHHKGALEVDQLGARPLEPQNRGIVAGGYNLVASDRNGGDPLRRVWKADPSNNVTVVINNFYAGRGRK